MSTSSDNWPYDTSFAARQRRKRLALEAIEERRKYGGRRARRPDPDVDGPEALRRWEMLVAGDVVKRERHDRLRTALARLSAHQEGQAA